VNTLPLSLASDKRRACSQARQPDKRGVRLIKEREREMKPWYSTTVVNSPEEIDAALNQGAEHGWQLATIVVRDNKFVIVMVKMVEL